MGNMPSWTARFGTDDIPTLLGHMVALRTSPNGPVGLKAHWSQFRPYADLALFREQMRGADGDGSGGHDGRPSGPLGPARRRAQCAESVTVLFRQAARCLDRHEVPESEGRRW